MIKKIKRLIKVFKVLWKHMDNDFYNTGFVLDNKISGVSYESIVIDWVSTYINKGWYVVLMDISLDAKYKDFWDKVPSETKTNFSKDVCILKCKSFKEMINLCSSIERNFALAFGFENGVLWEHNDYKTAC